MAPDQRKFGSGNGPHLFSLAVSTGAVRLAGDGLGNRAVYGAANPQGLLEIYQSSFFHFAPGLSDTVALTLKRMPADSLIQGDSDSAEKEHVFNIRLLTNNRPYLSGFIKPGDLLHFFQQLDTISDE